MKCCSFDVFDTVLVRRVIAPSEVFRIMGERLAPQAPADSQADFAEQFIEWRRRAEGLARKETTGEEITLADIWRILSNLLPATMRANLSGEIELQAEEEVLGPISRTQVEIARRRAEGKRILFISDIYLPQAFLQRLLDKFDLLKPGDGLYVSSEIGLTKRTGNLFRHVLEKEGIAPGDLFHTGDHPDSDVRRPRSLGISASHFREVFPTKAEQLMASQSFSHSPNWLDQAGKMRFARLSQSTPEDELAEGVRIFVGELLGPFLAIFAAWVIEQARARKISRLYFASRDARLLWAVCRRICEKNNLSIECHYLLISRQAIMLPSVTEISPEGIPWLERDFELSLLPRMLAKLEFPYEDFLPAWREKYPDWQPNQILSSREQRDDFWKTLRQPVIAERILAAAKSRREHALAYFGKMGMLDPMPVGLVDLGWFLTCQGALNKVCSEKRATPIQGLYLALQGGHLALAEAGPATAIFYQRAPDLPEGSHEYWAENITILEHLIGLSNHAGTRAYEANGPVRFKEQIFAYNQELFAVVEKELLRYLDLLGDSWAAFAQDRDQAAALMDRLIATFFKNPSPACVEVLRKLAYSKDQNHADAIPLITPYTWAQLLGRVLPRKWRLNLGVDGAFLRPWPEASWMVSPPGGRAARVIGLGYMALIKLAKKAVRRLKG